MLKTLKFIEIWFIDQNNRPLEIGSNVNITVITLVYIQNASGTKAVKFFLV